VDMRAEVRVPAPTVRVRVAPPVVREEVRIAQPSPRHVWVPGYWGWRGRSHYWVGGRWAVPPAAGRIWIEPRWVTEGGIYVFHPGYGGYRAERVVVEPSPEVAVAPPVTVVEREPPPPQEEVQPPAPSREHFWIRGYWAWEGHEHVWVPGHWESHRPGWVWVQAEWVRHGHSWHWRPGHWQRE